MRKPRRVSASGQDDERPCVDFEQRVAWREVSAVACHLDGPTFKFELPQEEVREVVPKLNQLGLRQLRWCR